MHADELADLLPWCAALSTNPADLAGAVLLAAGQRWSVLVDSLADLRELTVKTFLETTQTPDPGVRDGLERLPEELRDVVAAYDRLPKIQRAVLMLSYLEGVTNAEIAGIVDRSVARVRQELDRGLDTIGGDPYAVRAALDIASWHQPAPAEVSRAFQRRSRVRARRRRRVGLVGVAVGTVAAVLLTVTRCTVLTWSLVNQEPGRFPTRCEAFRAGRSGAERSSANGRQPICALNRRGTGDAPSRSVHPVPRG